MSDRERQLLMSAKDGCVAAFEELIKPHQGRIYNLMLKICGNEFEASQLAQEVFVKVFGALNTGTAEGGIAFSVYRTAGEVSRLATCKSKMIS